ncbi:hypothetical protein JI721_14485 [Alicyclobacillus cycloheptanicus]|uniref:Uncharacterized protein n=1 Tax=Alicyclobacillus cycloheptanicus TaxID=1457 RepID=A0ABT9XL99_9BACL|nr:hypothetical protein [Alicyclobacillus cycloheptanicus]MDQ0191084.1 hypothetical protein [Alicyclobacillus cycloheptanicus]WDM00878.1 hypothetical protein JI721_14485 [Alicyclobacillus cycloheptanicus]
MKVVTVSKSLFNPIPLPGMGRSIEVNGVTERDIAEIRDAFSQSELFVEFAEKPGDKLHVKQLWANPHSPQITLFV